MASIATATCRKPTVIAATIRCPIATHVTPKLSRQVLGKPEPLLLELLMTATEPPLQPHRTVMIGDRLAAPDPVLGRVAFARKIA